MSTKESEKITLEIIDKIINIAYNEMTGEAIKQLRT